MGPAAAMASGDPRRCRDPGTGLLIGGDSFDYALNDVRSEFAIVGAMGRVCPPCERCSNQCLEECSARPQLAGGPRTSDRLTHISSADSDSSRPVRLAELLDQDPPLINAGHPLPLLVNGTSANWCEPSMPMGLPGRWSGLPRSHHRAATGLFYTDDHRIEIRRR